MGIRQTDHFLFFADDISHDIVMLDEVETRHLTGALRSCVGDKVQVTDGKGGRAICVFDSVVGRNARLCVDFREYIERKPPFITLGIGLPERNAFESILSDATALGVCRIIPIHMRYCQKRWWDDWGRMNLRFRQLMITALKQSQGFFLPQITSPCHLEDTFSICSGAMLVADPAGSAVSTFFMVESPQSITCYIGPPGGFDEGELQQFERHGVAAVKIAPQRLRTELAATVICAQLHGVTH